MTIEVVREGPAEGPLLPLKDAAGRTRVYDTHRDWYGWVEWDGQGHDEEAP